jgi:phenylalanyl-tRNA synthetase beta chain
LSATAPPWRSDITIEDDLVEEVARIVGYDSIPTEMFSTAIPHHEGQELRAFRERVRDLLVRQGLQETISYSAVGLDLLRKAGIAEDDAGLLAVANPMSRDFKYMRPTLRASLMNTLAYNVARDSRALAIFEIGRVYLKQGEDLPREPEIAAGLLYGRRTGEGWLSPQGSYDFYDAKGIVESLLGRLGAQGEFRAHGDNFLHPGKAASVTVNGAVVGALGEVHPLVEEAFEIDDGVVVFFELDLNRLFDALSQSRQSVKPLARFPASLRDISILVDRDVPAARVQRIIEGQPLVEQTVLFDVYEGEEAPPGKVSLGYRIHFRAPNRTLSARDVNRSLARIVSLLERDVGAVLRGGAEGGGG